MKHRRTSWHAYAFEILLLSSIGSLVSAQRLRPSPIPQVHAPVNPEYVAYLDAVMADRWQTVTPDGHGLGHIPSPILHDFNFAPGTRPRLGDSPPAAYTLPADRLPPIRNQGTCGSCWAHAVYGSMETGIRPGDTFDFSENHLKNNHGWDWTCCQGGNPWCSNAYFGRWAGPLSEDDDAYDPVEANCHTSTGTPRRHLLDMWFLPTDDPAVLKDVLYHYGGILTGYYAESGYYGSSATAYYYPPSGAATSGNHEVTIVGYDDSYPRTNFNAANRPSADGAWYIRNSWGAFNSLGGYLWISYEDKFCAKETNALYLPPTPPTNVPTIYCVDEMGWVGYLGYGSPWDTTWAEPLHQGRRRGGAQVHRVLYRETEHKLPVGGVAEPLDQQPAQRHADFPGCIPTGERDLHLRRLPHGPVRGRTDFAGLG